MPTWLDMVGMEMGHLKQERFMEPSAEFNKERDHKVGIVEVELQKLYGLAMQWKKTAMEMGVKARFENEDLVRDQMILEITQLDQKADLLLSIFWVSIKDTYELWDKPSVGIRRGWMVVWCDAKPTPLIDEILGGIFGEE